MSTYSLAETAEIVQRLQPETIEDMVDLLADLRERRGTLFPRQVEAPRTRRMP